MFLLLPFRESTSGLSGPIWAWENENELSDEFYENMKTLRIGYIEQFVMVLMYEQMFHSNSFSLQIKSIKWAYAG